MAKHGLSIGPLVDDRKPAATINIIMTIYIGWELKSSIPYMAEIRNPTCWLYHLPTKSYTICTGWKLYNIQAYSYCTHDILTQDQTSIFSCQKAHTIHTIYRLRAIPHTGSEIYHIQAESFTIDRLRAIPYTSSELCHIQAESYAIHRLRAMACTGWELCHTQAESYGICRLRAMACTGWELCHT